MAVSYEEMQGSPVSEGWQADGFTAQRKLICAWGQRHVLAQTLIAGAGASYPHFPLARARSVTISPLEARNLGVGSKSAYEKAVLTVEYSTANAVVPSESEAQELISESLTPAAEALVLPVTSQFSYAESLYRWANGTEGDLVLEKEAPTKVTRLLNYRVTRYQVSALTPAMYNLIGKVNASPVTAVTLGMTFDPETLLYTDPEMSRVITTAGAQKWNVTMSFTYRPNGWNRFWRSASGTFERMYHNADFDNVGGPADPYETGDFTEL